MNISPRPGGAAAIRKLVLHLNVGPEVEGGARGLLRYLQGVGAGYHEIVDDKESVIGAQPDQVVWGASGMNEDGYHLCVIANLQDRAGWTDMYSSAELLIAARRFAELCHQLNIPPVHLADPQIADRNAKGICDHFGVNRAIVKPAVARGDNSMGPGDHTDVGADFPWDIFMSHVTAFYGGVPAPPPKPPEEDVKLLFEANMPAGYANPFCGVEIDITNQTVKPIGDAGFVPAPGPYIANGGHWLNAVRIKDDTDGVARVRIVNDKGEKYDFRLKARP